MTFGKLSGSLAFLLLLTGLSSAQGTAGGEAMVKLLGLLAGEPQAVVFSESEVTTLLESPAFAPRVASEAGLADLEVTFRPGEAHVSGRLDPSRLGPFAGTNAAPQPVELVLGIHGEDGVGSVSLLRVVIAGLELPPASIEQALAPVLIAPFFPPGRSLPASGESFPLPWGLESVELSGGALSLRPRSR